MDFNIIREIIHDDVDRNLKHHQHSVPKTQKSDQPINWLGRRTGVFLDQMVKIRPSLREGEWSDAKSADS